MADPAVLIEAVAAKQAVEFLGMPEGALALIQAAVYLACAPKSNSLYEAHKSVISDVHNTINDPVPVHLRNSVTKLT